MDLSQNNARWVACYRQSWEPMTESDELWADETDECGQAGGELGVVRWRWWWWSAQTAPGRRSGQSSSLPSLFLRHPSPSHPVRFRDWRWLIDSTLPSRKGSDLLASGSLTCSPLGRSIERCPTQVSDLGPAPNKAHLTPILHLPPPSFSCLAYVTQQHCISVSTNRRDSMLSVIHLTYLSCRARIIQFVTCEHKP